MTLSEFLKMLYKYYGNNEQMAAFVRGLFSAAIDDACELFPDDSLPQKLYNGNSSVSKNIAKKISPNLKRESFVNFLDKLTDDAILNLCKDFEFVPPDVSDMAAVEMNVFGKVYEMFVSYVDNAGNKAYRFISSTATGQMVMWNQAASIEIAKEHGVYKLPEVRESENTTLSLLIETNGKCPFCRKSLLRDKDGRSIDNYAITHIYPAAPTAETAEELAGVKKLSTKLESSYNKIALCPQCSATYQTDTSLDEYNRLVALKKDMLTYSTARERVDDAMIEQEIEEVVRRLAVANPNHYTDLNYDVVSVEDKIPRDNTLFFQKVFNNVVERFNCIKDIFNQLSSEHRLNFEEVASEMRLAFLKADKDGLPQEQVFEILVEKIRGSNRSLSTSACEAVVAFFVQDCEVFNVIFK